MRSGRRPKERNERTPSFRSQHHIGLLNADYYFNVIAVA